MIDISKNLKVILPRIGFENKTGSGVASPNPGWIGRDLTNLCRRAKIVCVGHGNRLNHRSERNPAKSERIAATAVRNAVISCFSERITKWVARLS